MPRPPDADSLARLADLLAQGRSCRQAARELGVGAATAIRWAHRIGFVSAHARRLAPDERDALRQTLATGTPARVAAAHFGVSRSTVSRLFPASDARRRALRARLLAFVRAGQTSREAAAALGLSRSTALRWLRESGVAAELRRAAPRHDPRAVELLERGASPIAVAAQCDLTPAALARLAAHPRLAADRLRRRGALFAALASGLSRRKAATAAGVPVSTAIRWARERTPDA